MIDIGCWIGDNAVAWAKILPTDSIVFAIDPDFRNISFVRSISTVNGLGLKLVALTAVCSDQPSQEIFFEGSLSHARFSNDSSKRPAPLVTQTLDNLVGGHSHYGGVGLIHIDVEDMEFKVLQGALKILSDDKPIVIYEQHLSRFDYRIIALLRCLNYRIFMINEIIQENSLDCRNFLAVDADVSASVLSVVKSAKYTSDSIIIPATLGPKLIEIDDLIPRSVDSFENSAKNESY